MKIYSEKKSKARSNALGAEESQWARSRREGKQPLPGLRLTQRDASILMAVYRYRALTTPQIERLFFSEGAVASAGIVAAVAAVEGASSVPNQAPKPNTRCQYRLQLLFRHGYLQRDEQPQKLSEGRKPFVYWLGRKGAGVVEELLDGEELDWKPKERQVSPLFLEHLLATNDVRVAIETAARRHNFSIATWLDDRTLKHRQMADVVILHGPQGGAQKASVVPDGYFVLDSGQHLYHHFLEIDLGTETGVATKWGRRDWSRKVQAYLEYYRSGKYQARYKTQGSRILIVTTGERRLANLKTVTEEAGGRSRFWFTTFAQVRHSDVLLAPIWRKAGEEELHTLIW